MSAPGPSAVGVAQAGAGDTPAKQSIIVSASADFLSPVATEPEPPRQAVTRKRPAGAATGASETPSGPPGVDATAPQLDTAVPADGECASAPVTLSSLSTEMASVRLDHAHKRPRVQDESVAGKADGQADGGVVSGVAGGVASGATGGADGGGASGRSGGNDRVDHADSDSDSSGDCAEDDEVEDATAQANYDFSSDSDDDSGTPEAGGRLSRPFDVKLLYDSIRNGEATLERVAGKDVVMIVGKTGSGKSTLIQGIAGRKLHAATHTTKKFGTAHEKVVFEAAEPLPEFQIGHVQTSMTKHIGCYTREATAPKTEEVVYLDTPGFEDTDGHEIDIATSVMLSKVAKKCRSLRFVVLINCASLLEDRGGAIRAVLKLIRSFVSDFAQARQSFKFLFTHTEKITTGTAGPKDFVRAEIAGLITGTTDDEVRGVLSFISQSLKKDFPFAGVFHPVDSDMPTIVQDIEKLVKLANKDAVGNCCLTKSSQMTLSSEILSLVQRVRLAVEKDCEDMAGIGQDILTIRTLREHVDIEDVRKAYSQAVDIVKRHIGELRVLIDGEVEKGTATDREFGEASIAGLTQAMLQLRSLSSLFPAEPAEDLQPRITSKVKALQKQVEEMANACTFEGIHRPLKKLHAWSKGFDFLSSLFQETVESISVRLDKTVAKVTEFEATKLEEIPQQQLEETMVNLIGLKSISNNCDELSEFGLKTASATEAVEKIETDISATLTCWEKHAVPTMKKAELAEDSLQLFVSQARAVERLHEVLEASPVFPKLITIAARLRQALANDAVEHFAAASEQFKAKLSKRGDTGRLSDCQRELAAIRTASVLFGTWQPVPSEYASVVRHAKSILETSSGELEAKSQSATLHGIKDDRDVQALESFVACSWFDDFLPQDSFVGNCSIKFKKAYWDRIVQVQRETKTHLDVLAADQSDSETSAACANLKLLLVELQLVQSFASVLGDASLANLESDARSQLRARVHETVEYAQEVLSNWQEAVGSKYEGVDVLTETINGVLCTIEMMRDIHSENREKLDCIRTKICSAFESYGKSVQETLESADYKLKAQVLAVVEDLGNHRYTSPSLPSFEKLKEQVRAQVAAAAKEVEDKVSETSEFDEIDGQLEKLKEAQVLDRFTANEARSRLRPLLQLREQKETQVEEHLNTMIEQYDFNGLVEFLRPMSASKDQVKKQNFQRYKTRICKELDATAERVDRQLKLTVSEEKARTICAGLETLQQAKQLSELIRDARVDQRFNQLKKLLNQKVVQLLDTMPHAIQKLEFGKLGTQKVRAMILHEQLDSFLVPGTRKKYKEFLAKYKQSIEKVQGLRKTYVETSFVRGSQLLTALDSLKNVDDNVSMLPELTELYENTKKELADSLNQIYRKISGSVSEKQCFDDAITAFSRLDRHLQSSLNDHLGEEELVFDCGTALDNWKREREKHKADMQFDGERINLHKIQQWVCELDGLHPSAWGSSVRSWYTNETYDNSRRCIQTKVSDTCANCKSALKNGNQQLVQDCISSLELIDQHLEKHIPAVARRLAELKQLILETFEELCTTAQQRLQSDPRQFESLFADYRGLVLDVPCVMTSEAAQNLFGLTNQLMHESLVCDIAQLRGLARAFDFPKVKSKVDYLRAFGRFLTEKVAVFHEEVKCSEGVEMDRWLEDLSKVIFEHFSCGRDLSLIKHYAALRVAPSASKPEIKKAWQAGCRLYHSDKSDRDPSGTKFRQVADAWEALKDVKGSANRSGAAKPFDCLLKDIATNLRNQVREYLSEQRYDRVEKILVQLDELHVLDDLVTPKLNSQQTRSQTTKLVGDHVAKVKVEVDSNWDERKYSDLNENITDLKLMEDNFKEYPAVWSTSWNDGIVAKVEGEIKTLGEQAGEYLRSESKARSNIDAFRADFIKMGSVLVELPLFKTQTKTVMSSVLEMCLSSDWGHSFLFEFGMSLQRHDENDSEDDNRIAQVIIGEFPHFKEVQTMVWNQQTLQKPAEDTVRDIEAWTRSLGSSPVALHIDSSELLNSQVQFETEYKKLLAVYIQPDSDLNELVQKTVAAANRLKPLTCDSNWGSDVKSSVPFILAGVFALFTVLKSGDSFNRLAETADGNSENLLKKPHNIQVFTLLCMLGCGTPSRNSLESQLMQIRTGEGKSIILGAAAAVLGLLGFRVRCVCYSEYLSNRDYDSFKDVFQHLKLIDFIKYSKITRLSEDTTAAKGDIRKLTERLLRDQMDETMHPENVAAAGGGSQTSAELSAACSATGHAAAAAGAEVVAHQSKKRKKGKKEKKGNKKTKTTSAALAERQGEAEEILLVDEVDVFFGAEFYGQTYNQVAQLREPEVADILRHIWATHKRGGRRQRLSDVKAMPAYAQLLHKMPRYAFLLDNEISSMLDQVRRVDEEPYHLDRVTDRIGYKVMDTISYEATYGYRTVFAYLKEADNGNLKNVDATLATVLTMPISCGQFSYANISPARILGVSGTLEAMSEYEKDVMAGYGIETFVNVPSVYGKSHFKFDQADEGIVIESSTSDYFHSIGSQIAELKKQKRAVIVFFQDNVRLKEFTNSATFRKLGRQKKLLTEEMTTEEKEFAINKAATAGQITISSAVFGRGTDFFCKDDRVQKAGGVHVIQAFLSTETSEEIQLQGRTARQGKKGSYSMVLLESDLEAQFGIPCGEKDQTARKDRYTWLRGVREKQHAQHCEEMRENLVIATDKDLDTHTYFDALLRSDVETAHEAFKEIYSAIKKRGMPSAIDLDLAFVVDITGSMAPYAQAAAKTIKSIVDGQDSVVAKLQTKFPEIEFNIRVAAMGSRDIDDGNSQFEERVWQDNHFVDDVQQAVHFVDHMVQNPSGGGDIAEDHLGAINHCANWRSGNDWTSQIKFMMLLTDAPMHGMVPPKSAKVANADSYSVRHPKGITADQVVGKLLEEDIGLFLCSFNPALTARTEQELSQRYLKHPANAEQKEITTIAMVPEQQLLGGLELATGCGQHIIFVLDESGSMSRDWTGVEQAYREFLARRRQNQSETDLVSVVQFSSSARVTATMAPLSTAPSQLVYVSGGTAFAPAASAACSLAQKTPDTHKPVVVFMSDGCSSDAGAAAGSFGVLNREIRSKYKDDLELHVIAFGSGAHTAQLQQIAGSSRAGKLHMSADTAELSNVFADIAGGQDVAGLLEAQIGKGISDAVTDKLSLEYFG